MGATFQALVMAWVCVGTSPASGPARPRAAGSPLSSCTRPRAGPRRATLSRLLAWLLAIRLAPLPARTRAAGRRTRRTRPRAGLWRPSPLCDIISRALSLALVSSRDSPRRSTTRRFYARRAGWRVGPRCDQGPARARLTSVRDSRDARARVLSPLARIGPSMSRCGLLPHPAKISPGPCDHADGVEAGLPTGWAGLVPRRRLGQRRIKSNFAKACVRKTLGPGAS